MDYLFIFWLKMWHQKSQFEKKKLEKNIKIHKKTKSPKKMLYKEKTNMVSLLPFLLLL